MERVSGSVLSDHPTSPRLSDHCMSGAGRFPNENPAFELILSFGVIVDVSALQVESQNCKHWLLPLLSAQLTSPFCCKDLRSDKESCISETQLPHLYIEGTNTASFLRKCVQVLACLPESGPQACGLLTQEKGHLASPGAAVFAQHKYLRHPPRTLGSARPIPPCGASGPWATPSCPLSLLPHL